MEFFKKYRLMRVHGDSMKPTLQPGEVIAVRNRAYSRRQPCRGEIVAARPAACGGRLLVKRLVGVPQDEVAGKGQRWRLGPDQFFLLGERLDDSADSRSFGPVTRQELVGPVALRVWPWKMLTGTRTGEGGDGQGAQVS